MNNNDRNGRNKLYFKVVRGKPLTRTPIFRTTIFFLLFLRVTRDIMTLDARNEAKRFRLGSRSCVFPTAEKSSRISSLSSKHFGQEQYI